MDIGPGDAALDHGDGSDAGGCASVDDTCDGEDDDCDGMVDESVPATCDGDGDGCRDGIASCTDGVLSCSDAPSRVADPCDGPDADSVEEGALSCQGNQLRCLDDCVPEAESCSQRDDDCDGVVDEGVCADTGDGAGCGDPILVAGGALYLFCEGPRSFMAAASACAERGYDFVAAEDPDELMVIGAIASDTERWHLGGMTDATTPGGQMDRARWRWVATGDAIADEVWKAAEPRGRGACAQLPQASDDRSGIADSDCGVDRPFICEGSLVP